MKKFLFVLFLAGLVSLPMAAWAELAYVSGVDEPVAADGNPEDVAVFHPDFVWDPEEPVDGDFRGAGFPLWYQDTVGLRLTLCLDGEEEEFPCGWEGSPVFLDGECTEPLYTYQDVVGFGDEAFYFKATSHPFDVPLDNGGSAQLALLLETTWFGDERFDEDTGTIGEQDIFIEAEDGTCGSAVGADLHRVEPGYELLFARIRIRLLDGVSGWYRVTHPYGVKTFYHDAGERSQVRQQIGDFRAPGFQDYTIALNDPGAFANDPNSPFIDVGNSNVTDIDQSLGFSNDAAIGFKNIGPFLVQPDYFLDPDLRIEEESGLVFQYIGNPIDEPDSGHQVVGSPYFDDRGRANDGTGEYANYFKIEFQAGPISDVPTGEWSIVGLTDLFNVAGKVAANCAEGVNEPPVVAADERELIATAVNRPVTFDPFINDQPGDLPIFKLMTLFEEVAEGAEVIFNPDRGTVTYVPVADQAYADEFTYTLRDACGTESAGTAMLTVVVEDLQINRADYRTRTGRWLISGTSSHTSANEIRLYAGQFDPEDEAANRLIGTAPVGDDGAWTFSGKATASPGAGTVTAVSALGVVSDAFALVLR